MKFLKKRFSIKSIYLALSGWDLSWQGVVTNSKGEWWLILQVVLILAHFFPPIPPTFTLGFFWPRIFIYPGFCLICLGTVQGVRSFVSLGESLSPLPKPKITANLVIRGSYRYCRHPIYQSILIISMGTIFVLGSLLHMFLFISLSIVLIGKAKTEEKHLQKIHKEYKSYLKNTPAIINNMPIFDWRS